MLEFNDRTFKLSQIDANDVAGDLAALLVEGEQVLMAFRGAGTTSPSPAAGSSRWTSRDGR